MIRQVRVWVEMLPVSSIWIATVRGRVETQARLQLCYFRIHPTLGWGCGLQHAQIASSLCQVSPLLDSTGAQEDLLGLSDGRQP